MGTMVEAVCGCGYLLRSYGVGGRAKQPPYELWVSLLLQGLQEPI